MPAIVFLRKGAPVQDHVRVRQTQDVGAMAKSLRLDLRVGLHLEEPQSDTEDASLVRGACMALRMRQLAVSGAIVAGSSVQSRLQHLIFSEPFDDTDAVFTLEDEQID